MKWEMKTIAVPSSRSRRRVENRRSTSGGDSAEVGSSRMMMRAPGKQHAGDLDQLLQADRQVAEPRKRIDVDAEPRELLTRFARHAPPLHETEAIGRLGAEKHVLGDRQIGRDAEFLMNHGDAGRARIARPIETRTSFPSSTKRPENSACTPAMIFISVLLPAPFSPTRPWISPAESAKSTPRSASTPPKALVIWCSSRMGERPCGITAQIRK